MKFDYNKTDNQSLSAKIRRALAYWETSRDDRVQPSMPVFKFLQKKDEDVED